uniref:Myosin motor domain-containing protein n=1 Tax=Steinernema glaseri TaxID=37863 RepID=A0A1I8ADS9_9BILA
MDGSAAASASVGSPKNFDLPGLALPALNSVQARIRRITLQRNVAGDFGFTIRRTQPRLNTSCPIVFAEPCDVRAGPPRPSDMVSGLLPGDELLEVNSKRVSQMSREQLLAEIRNAGSSIELVVRTVPEFSELTSTRKGNFDDSALLDAPEGESSAGNSIPEDQKYWLIHKEGYSACQFVGSLPDGKVCIKVAGRELTVETSDIDRANPHSLDRIDDIANLRYLNETSGVHLIRQRYGSTLQYVNAGSQVLTCLTVDNDCGSVNDNLAKLFRGCRRNQMPAHIYATAQQVYRNVQMNAKSQSVILSGVSGSGKTSQLRNFMHYLCGVAGWTNALTYETLSAVLGILEAFGNCATRLNKNSSRFLNLLSFGFDNSAALRAAKVQTFLLETTRVTKRPEKESNFHVFYYMWEGADEALRARLKLDAVSHPIIKPFREDDDKEIAREGWRKLLQALELLNISQEERDAICNILGAIFHLCCAESTPTVSSKANFLRATNAEIAASLLGVPFESLYQSVFRGKAFSAPGAAKKTSLNRFSMSNRVEDGQQALNNFVQALYRHLFVSITALINRRTSTGSSLTWINILDCPGSNFNLNWTREYQSKPASLTDLIYNYANERLSELFHDSSFRDLAQLYEAEQVDVDVEQPISCPHTLTRIFDQKQHLLNSTDINKRSAEKRGLLWILEEESMFPGASDDALLERIFVHLGDSHLVSRCSEPRQFSVLHGMKAFNVRYSVDGWVKQAQPTSARDSLHSLLSASSSSVISSYASMQMSYVESEAKLRRLTHSIQTLESAARAENSRAASGFCSGVLMQLDYIISSINRASKVHFVYCVQPYTSASISGCDSLAMDVPYVRQQLRSVLLIDAIRSHNRGYAERISFRDFRRRFQCLVPPESISAMLDDRTATMKILERMNIREHRYRLGISQALLRSDVLTELEDCRDLGLSGVIVDFQQACRQYLARRWLARRRIQEVAIKCLQRNANAYIKIREWSWWKLYNRVVPILPTAREDDVHRSLKERLQKLEAENAALIAEKSRWHEKITELEVNLNAERDSVQNLSSALNRELEQRSRIEAEVQKRVLSAESSEKSSRVATAVGWEEDERTMSLQKEVQQIREINEGLKLKAQKASLLSRDLEDAISTLQDKNAHLEKTQKGHDQKVQALLAEVEQSKEKSRKFEEAAETLQRKVDTINVQVQELKATNTDLRATVSRYRKDLDGAIGETSNVSSHLATSKMRLEFEDKLRQKEEELEDLQDEHDTLQQTVSQLKLNADRAHRDHQRALEEREKEFDEMRTSMQRKIRALEEECSDLTDRNSTLLKQNRIYEETVRENGKALSRASTDSGDNSYKEEYRKAMILLRDTQSMLQHERDMAPKKVMIRQLQQQIEDAELNAMHAAKSKHLVESDLFEVRTQLDDLRRAKASLEGKLKIALKERTALSTTAEELDDQLQQLISKHKTLAQQCTEKSITIADQLEEIEHLQKSNGRIMKELQDVNLAFDQHRASSVDKNKYILLEQKLHERETRIDILVAERSRFESKAIRLDEEIDALQGSLDESKEAVEREVAVSKKLRKEIELMKDKIEDVQRRETEFQTKYKAERAEKENFEFELQNATAQLKLAQVRVENLRGELRSADSHSDLSRSSLTSRCSNYPDMNGSCPSL